MKLNKEKTGNKIIKHVQNTPGLTIDIDGFWKEIKTVADFKKACEFCGIKPVYDE